MNIRPFRILLLSVATSFCANLSFAQIDNSIADYQDTDKLLEMAQDYIQSGQRDKAESLISDAFERAESVGERLKAAKNLAKFYCADGRPELSVKPFDVMLNDQQVQSDSSVLMQVYEGLGSSYFYLTQYVKAIKCYRLAESMMSAFGDSVFNARVYCGMAKTLLKAGDVTIAYSFADSAVTLAPVDNLNLRIEALHTQSLIEDKMGRYKKAFQELLEADSLRLQLSESQLADAKSDVSESTHIQQRNEVRDRYEQKLQALQAELEYSKNNRKLVSSAFVALGLITVIMIVAFIVATRKYRFMSSRYVVIDNELAESQRVIQIVADDTQKQFDTLTTQASNLLRNMRDDDSPNAAFDRQIYTSAQKLQHTMANILAWSRRSSSPKPNMQSVRLLDRLQVTIDSCEIMAADKGLVMHNDIDPDVSIVVDPEHLDLIIYNLVFNAVKFTTKGGSVSISAFKLNEKAHIHIEDTGIGMAPELIKAFNNNEPMSASNGTANERGTGLGLAICRELIHANGGDIIVESALGEGTSINVTLQAC